MQNWHLIPCNERGQDMWNPSIHLFRSAHFLPSFSLWLPVIQIAYLKAYVQWKSTFVPLSAKNVWYHMLLDIHPMSYDLCPYQQCKTLKIIYGQFCHLFCPHTMLHSHFKPFSTHSVQIEFIRNYLSYIALPYDANFCTTECERNW